MTCKIHSGQYIPPFVTNFSIPVVIEITERSVMITQEMCPIRAEISTHKHLGKCFICYLYFAVIGCRQNYFYILPNFGDFGAKISFFSLYNQPKTK